MQTPKVTQCQVEECAYNQNCICHAMAITVGNTGRPRCDTFCISGIAAGDPSACAVVGACKASSCTHNESLECAAPSVNVGYEADEPDCLTYTRK